MTGSRPGDVPWRTAPSERPFPDAGADGTGSLGGDDALRAPEVASDATAPGRWETGPSRRPSGPGGASPPDSLPAPRSGATADAHDSPGARTDADDVRRSSPRGSVADDALAAPTRLPDLPPLVAGDDPDSRATVERWMDDDRAAHADEQAPQPYRVLPTPPPPRPTLIDRSPARRTPPAGGPEDEDDDAREDPQVRAWREEREFEAQFGPWRAGSVSRPPMRRSTLVSPPVLLLAFVLIVVLYYLLTT